MLIGAETHVVSFCLKAIKRQGDPVLNWRHQLPHTVLVVGILSGPAWGAEGAIQAGDEAATGSCWRE